MASLRKHFASAGTIRRAAMNMSLNRKTVARKLEVLGIDAEARLRLFNLAKPKSIVIEFDDLETFEHTKCKPLSITIAVESISRRILGIEVSPMGAKGMLVERAKKYGPRFDGRAAGRDRLFTAIKPLMRENAVIKSDSNPHYPASVKKHFPKARHVAYKGKRGSLGGQGSSKKYASIPSSASIIPAPC